MGMGMGMMGVGGKTLDQKFTKGLPGIEDGEGR